MTKIYCSNCGQLIDVQSNFCRYCGAPQHGPQAAVYRAQAPALPEAASPVPEVVRINKANATTLPEVIERRHLSPQVIWSFFLNYLALTGIVLPMFAIAIFFEPLLVGVVFASYILITFFVAIIIYQHFYFEIDRVGFKKDYGVIHKRHVSIPFKQIQNVNINRTIIDRILGIAKIDIETAGSSNTIPREILGGNKTKAEGFLAGVSLADAKIIHDLLLHRAAEAQEN